MELGLRNKVVGPKEASKPKRLLILLRARKHTHSALSFEELLIQERIHKRTDETAFFLFFFFWVPLVL